MPLTTSAITVVGFAITGARIAAHSSFCNCAVRALTFCSSWKSRVV